MLTADGETSKLPKHTKLRFLLAILKYTLAYKVTGAQGGNRGAGAGLAGPAGARPMLVRETKFLKLKDMHFKQVLNLCVGGAGTNLFLTSRVIKWF